MVLVGCLVIAFGVCLIVLRRGAQKGIEKKANQINNPTISKSVRWDKLKRIAEAGILVILIGIAVVLDAVGVF